MLDTAETNVADALKALGQVLGVRIGVCNIVRARVIRRAQQIVLHTDNA
jgi:hypothetical protein